MVEVAPRRRFSTEEDNAAYTQPLEGLSPGHVGFVGSWGMSQRLAALGHIEVQAGKTVVVLHG
jgi:hypothetical protein